jgi:hypothetical protein
MTADIAELVARLARAAAGRAAIAPLSEGVAGLDAAGGYAIQPRAERRGRQVHRAAAP